MQEICRVVASYTCPLRGQKRISVAHVGMTGMYRVSGPSVAVCGTIPDGKCQCLHSIVMQGSKASARSQEVDLRQLQNNCGNGAWGSLHCVVINEHIEEQMPVCVIKRPALYVQGGINQGQGTFDLIRVTFVEIIATDNHLASKPLAH